MLTKKTGQCFQGERVILPIKMPEHIPCPHFPTFHLHTATWLLQEVLAAMLVVPHLEAPSLLTVSRAVEGTEHVPRTHVHGHLNQKGRCSIHAAQV